MKKVFKLIVTMFAVFIATNSFAMDIGVMRPMETPYSLEIFCENFERDTSAIDALSDTHYTGTQDEKRTMARFKYAPLKNWAIAFEAGAADSEYSDGYAPIFGLGSHVVVYQNNGFYASVFAKATYAYDIEYIRKDSGSFDDLHIELRRKLTEEYWEYGAGFQLGKDWIPCSGARITGYTGAMASWISAEQEMELDYVITGPLGTVSDSEKFDNCDFEEDQPYMFFAGVEATLTKYEIGIRAESRFYDRTSFSIGLFKNF